MSPSQVLEQIRRARVAQQEAEAKLATLIDDAIGLGIGWPKIAAELGVTRQAARQHYHRRYRNSHSRQERLA
jgi:predicted transcriptional regulator